MNIETFLTPEVTAILITVVLLPFIATITRYVTKLLCTMVDELQKRIQNDKINHYIDHAEDAITTAVDSVTQTFVSSMKSKGIFTKEAALEAFNMAKNQAIQMIGTDARLAITEANGDLDIWIKNKIEAYIKNEKDILANTPVNITPVSSDVINAEIVKEDKEVNIEEPDIIIP